MSAHVCKKAFFNVNVKAGPGSRTATFNLNYRITAFKFIYLRVFRLSRDRKIENEVKKEENQFLLLFIPVTFTPGAESL